jgi:DNA helicase MCM8
MASALLSRFDLVFILLDRADEDHDRRISEHIMGISKAARGSHASQSQPCPAPGPGASPGGGEGVETLSQRLRKECAQYSTSSSNIDPALMRKYIEYARANVSPRLTPAAAKVLQRMYLTMRSQGPGGEGGDPASSGALPVTTRHLESLIRLSQARARMELRTTVWVWLALFTYTSPLSTYNLCLLYSPGN